MAGFTHVLSSTKIGGSVGGGFIGRMVMSAQPMNVSFSLPKPGPDLFVVGSLPQLFPVVYFH